MTKFFCMCWFFSIYISCRSRSNDNISHRYFPVFFYFRPFRSFSFLLFRLRSGYALIDWGGVKKCPPPPCKTTTTPFADLLMHQFDTLHENPKVIGSNFFELTLARTGGGGLMQPPHEFFWNGRRTAGRIALKFCTAYEASFAQLLAKNN